MAKITIYSVNTKATKEAVLPKNFVGEVNLELLAQALHVYRARRHIGLSKTKTRSEVNRTTKKWFKQKGTGRARHGARSAPIFVGGSKAHGPKGVKRELTLPTQMQRRALVSAMTTKVKAGKVCGVVGLGDIKKTKEAAELITKVSAESKRFLLVISEKNYDVKKFFVNIANMKIVRGENLNAYDVYFGGKIILDEELFKPKNERNSLNQRNEK